MAPIRRYLRITKYSVLECRIYLDQPGLAQSWLLNPRNPVLPRVIESVRPLVLPKLREERERSRKRSTKKKGIKDVVVEGKSSLSSHSSTPSTDPYVLYIPSHLRMRSWKKNGVVGLPSHDEWPGQSTGWPPPNFGGCSSRIARAYMQVSRE